MFVDLIYDFISDQVILMPRFRKVVLKFISTTGINYIELLDENRLKILLPHIHLISLPIDIF